MCILSIHPLNISHNYWPFSPTSYCILLAYPGLRNAWEPFAVNVAVQYCQNLGKRHTGAGERKSVCLSVCVCDLNNIIGNGTTENPSVCVLVTSSINIII